MKQKSILYKLLYVLGLLILLANLAASPVPKEIDLVNAAAARLKKPVLTLPRKNAIVKDYTPLFKWKSAGSLAVRYHLQVADNNSFTSPVVDEDVAGLSYQLPDENALAPNTKYFWRVQAFDAGSASTQSILSYFTTWPDVPPTLISPTDGMPTDAPVQFQWVGITNDTNGYQIQIGKSKAANGTVKKIVKLAKLPKGTTSYTLKKLKPGTYYWRVRAVGKGKNNFGNWSSTWSFEILTAAQILKIGVIAPLSGSVSSLGLSAREGMMLAIDEWNDAGGILGRKIEPVVEDSQCAADLAAPAANKLINQDGVDFIIGDICSSAAMAVSDIANPQGVVQISPSASNPDVTYVGGAVKPYTFRACYINPFQGGIAGKFAYQANNPPTTYGLGASKAFIIYDSSDGYVQGLADAFEAEFAQETCTVQKATYTSGQTDFSDILDQVKTSGADLIYLPSYINIVNPLADQARNIKGITIPIVGGDGFESTDLNINNVQPGYYTTHYSAEDSSAAVQNFITRYGAAYKDASGNPKTPDAIAALSYDAATLLLEAIKNANMVDPAAVKDILAGFTYGDLADSGLVTFLNNQGAAVQIFDSRHNPQKPAVILKLANGEAKYLTTINPTE